MNFGEFAREKRRIAGISQSQIAKGMGLVTRGAVQKLEAGIVHWRLDQLFLFASVLGIPAWKLIREYEQKGGDDIIQKKR